ncbi:hypothetical protein Droror1_Dr00002541 [Drosera rotundifolia]
MEVADLRTELLTKKCLGLRFLNVSYLEVTGESLRSTAMLPALGSLVMLVIDISRSDGISAADICSVVKDKSSSMARSISHF